MNFAFLKKIPEFEKLRSTCEDAERFVTKEPNISSAAARRAIEYIVKLLYSTLVSPYIEYLSTYEMLIDPVLMRNIKNQELIDTIHYIRKCGNRAVHDNNINNEEAMQVLEKLHYTVGEVCVFLGCIDSYPAFQKEFIRKDAISTVPMSELDIELSQTFIADLHTQIIKRRHEQDNKAGGDIQYLSDSRDAHKSQDSGANSKAAIKAVADYLLKELPLFSQSLDLSKGILILTASNGKKLSIAVKSGCPQLSTMVNGELQMLPGIDLLLYAPEFVTDKQIADQLHLFTREEFLRMWNDLGLIRKKVSSSMMRKYKEMYGPTFKTDKDKHADIIAVQSFNNSGKKSKLVKEESESKPKLTHGGVDLIRSYL